ncbi:MAG: AraC family transcriptional regulator, partial [Verrucomicrobiaceae bacterium]
FYTVPRAGHLVGGADHHIQRDHFPGHELILCLNGRGFVRVAGRSHPVQEGQFVWVNCHQPHEHGAVRSDPWEVYWIRIEGPRLARLSEVLSVTESPVFTAFDHAAAELLFRQIFTLLPHDTPEVVAQIHAAVAQLIALTFLARQDQPITEAPRVLRKAVERMRLFYFERHTVTDLASLCGMSPSHFSRVFKAAFGTSPIDWLRRERMNQAKRRLIETSDAIKQIAEQVGYNDRFFFSKDFKSITGLTPKQFRASEGKDRE